MEGEEKTGASLRSRSSSSAPHVPFPRMMPLSFSVKRQWSRHWMLVCSKRRRQQRQSAMGKGGNVLVTQQVDGSMSSCRRSTLDHVTAAGDVSTVLEPIVGLLRRLSRTHPPTSKEMVCFTCFWSPNDPCAHHGCFFRAAAKSCRARKLISHLCWKEARNAGPGVRHWGDCGNRLIRRTSKGSGEEGVYVRISRRIRSKYGRLLQCEKDA